MYSTTYCPSIYGCGMGGRSYSFCWLCHLESSGFLDPAVAVGKEMELWPLGSPQILRFKLDDGKIEGQTLSLMHLEMMNGLLETESVTLYQGLWSPWKLSHVLSKT